MKELLRGVGPQGADPQLRGVHVGQDLRAPADDPEEVALSHGGLDHGRLLGGVLALHLVQGAADGGLHATKGDGLHHILEAAGGRLGEAEREDQVQALGDGHGGVGLDRDHSGRGAVGHGAELKGEGEAPRRLAQLLGVVVVGDPQQVVPGLQDLAHVQPRVQGAGGRVQEVQLGGHQGVVAGGRLGVDDVHLRVGGEEVVADLRADPGRGLHGEADLPQEAILHLLEVCHRLIVPEVLALRGGLIQVQAEGEHLLGGLRLSGALDHP
mmetsp:Transcript_83191/g.243928  ORF Transcript_83191/g.243928 Transcript_83191/m.243928 type:complete len:268 (+) Transcript_83191:151-954(+)